MRKEDLRTGMIVVGNTVPSGHTAGRVFDINGISPTVMERHSKVIQILETKYIKNTNLKENNMRKLKDLNSILGHDTLLVAEFFKGYGSQSMSLDSIGVPNKVVCCSEIDPDAIISYASARFSQEELDKEINLTDDEIKKYLMDKNIGWDFQKEKSSIIRMKKQKLHKLYNSCILTNEMGDISIIDPNTLPDFDLMTYSSPCFIAGTLIMTDKGYKKIEDITNNDYVLTHTNSYKKVVKPMINKTNKLLKIRNMCSEDLYVTAEHPFYVRERYKIWNNDKRMYDRKFKEPTWVKAKDLNKDTYLGIAINKKSELPLWNGYYNEWYTNKFAKNKRVHKTNFLNEKFSNKDFWWIVGRYIGDGWLVDDSGFIICCAFDELEEITSVYDRLDMHYNITKERTVYRIQVSMREMNEYLKQFGKGAKNKHLTNDIFNLPVELLEGFIEGYMSADGCYTQGLYKASSISRELIYGIGQCVAKVYKTPFKIGLYKRKKVCVIEGRTVNQNDTYQIVYKKDKRKQDNAFYENGYIWCPISQIQEINENCNVYNMEVEEDNSYTANGIIVHNCTDFSVAGKQEGGEWTCNECGTKFNPIELGFERKCTNCNSTDIKITRSSLLFETAKIIRIKKPKYLLLENVKALTSKKFEPLFYKWCEWLEYQGYTNYWQVLNAKDYGVPQNRERVFMISILGEHDKYEFPQKEELKIRLKDILEDSVDEKYYINNDKTLELIEKIKDGRQGELPSGNKVECSSALSSREHRCGGWNEISGTLCARDYKDPKVVSIPCDSTLYKPKELDIANCITARYDAGIQNKQSIGVAVMEITQNRLGGLFDEGNSKHQAGSVWDKEALSPTLDTMQGGYRQPCICEQRTDEGLRFFKDNICGTLRTTDSCGDKRVIKNNTYRIRKLTPKECFRLMGVPDNIFDKIKSSGISDSQLYKQAGNSIVKDCLDKIFTELFFEK